MKTQIIFALIFSVLMLSACTNISDSATPTSVLPFGVSAVPTQTSTLSTPTSVFVSPLGVTVVPPQTLTPSTSTSASLLPTLADKTIEPGIYPVYWREGAAYVEVASGKTQELMRLYDESADISPDGDITYLANNSRNTVMSPNGQIIMYMNMKDGFLYNYDRQSKTKQKISQSDAGSYLRDWSGSWSPDGRYLIYAIDHPPQEFPSIYIANITQNTFSQVTDWNTVETKPVWSPDYQWIAFASDKAKANLPNGSYVGATDIFVMSTNCISNIETCKNSFIKQLTFTGVAGDAIGPTWNPSGSDIGFIYINGQTGDKDICIVDLNGKVTNLTNTINKYEDAFAWSPNGEKIVFRQYSPGDGTDLFVYQISNSSLTRITNTPATSEGTPAWSPDGKLIAFQENTDDSDSGIMIYSIESSSSRLIEGSSGSEFLFWAVFFPNTLPGTGLTVSPSGQGLNIRTDKSIDSPVVGKLNSGDKVEIVSQFNDDIYNWWNIKSEKGNGWVVQLYNWYLP